ncbi:tRNA uridine-5-carboxymethylaminomethyl(34) synthesis GTPase MnmE [Aureimonas sp. AU40]|uniref:tRNA uridine-5-carboxymethylaminomethyl(34) synthesis GTPase MnmE n=1 Tax=Aureimonas sp. AU40 TaxID=1637747 RepID=UPI0009E7F241|nr:tRNA uridine-5-carboxymethylaminomethyl(34) synthesis GTPase MnmE [Aureimonas sp. AU40]
MTASMLDDTILALSSGPLPAGVAVVRVSGPLASEALAALAGGVPEPRRASLRRLRAADGAEIDRALVLFFPGPNTATGEDLAEFHLHGGRAVVAALTAALLERPGFRLAEAGEFTRRSFANGRIDLTEAEGLADLLAAETEGQRRQALAQAGGAARALYEGWMRQLSRIRALLEASFDFSDEGDVSEDVSSGTAQAVGRLQGEIAAHLAGAHRAEIWRDGFRVAIAGAPNAGKSSLLNALAAREVAIVSAIPGTTRDVIEIRLDIEGMPVLLSDTAGLRETADEVEAIGVSRARERIGAADLVLSLIDPGALAEEPLIEAGDTPVLRITTKSDLYSALPAKFDAALSARTGAGLDALTRLIGARAREAAGDPSDLLPARTRHRDLLRQCLELLDGYDPALPPELYAETLRQVSDRLGTLTGRVGVEELLGLIFSEFCIGK